MCVVLFCPEFLSVINQKAYFVFQTSHQNRVDFPIKKTRIKKLYVMMKMQVPNRRDIKQQSKLAKSFMVLVKKKLNRDVLCRSKVFQQLMSLVFNPEGKFEEGVEKMVLKKKVYYFFLKNKAILFSNVWVLAAARQDTTESQQPNDDENHDDDDGSNVDIDDVGSDHDADCDSGAEALPLPPAGQVDQESLLLADSQPIPAELQPVPQPCTPKTPEHTALASASQPTSPEPPCGDCELCWDSMIPPTQPSPASTPLISKSSKGVENDLENKCVVIEDSPMCSEPKDPKEIDNKIRAVQKLIAQAKREKMAKTFSFKRTIFQCFLFSPTTPYHF